MGAAPEWGEGGFGALGRGLNYWLLFLRDPRKPARLEGEGWGSPGQRQVQPPPGRPAGAPAQPGNGPAALPCPDSWSPDQVQLTPSPCSTYRWAGAGAEFQKEIGAPAPVQALCHPSTVRASLGLGAVPHCCVPAVGTREVGLAPEPLWAGPPAGLGAWAWALLPLGAVGATPGHCLQRGRGLAWPACCPGPSWPDAAPRA